MSVLAQHVDRPDRRHRLVLLDDHQLRCLDCTRTLLVSAGPGSTSTSQIPKTTDPRCREHPFEHAGNCRWCTAERKAAAEPAPSKPLAGWAARTARPSPRRDRLPVPERQTATP